MDDRLFIDDATVFDNLDEQQVEFDGEVDGERLRFAVRHDVLEALSGERPDGNAVALFGRHLDPIAGAALAALGHDRGTDLIIVSENDLA